MKKVFLFLGIAACLTQGALAGPVGFGVRGGAAMANEVLPGFTNSPYESTDVLFGLSGGVFVDFGLSDHFSISPEANFTMKGVRWNINTIATNIYGQTVGNITATDTVSYNYLEVPVLLKAQTNLGPGFKGSLSAGPAPAFLLSANSNISMSGQAYNSAIVGQTFDLGVLFGAGIEISRFLVDLRYDLGLLSVTPGLSRGASNSVLSLLVGYRIQ